MLPTPCGVIVPAKRIPSCRASLGLGYLYLGHPVYFALLLFCAFRVVLNESAFVFLHVQISPQFHGNTVKDTLNKRKRPARAVTSETSVYNASTLTLKTLPAETRSIFRPLQFVGAKNVVAAKSRAAVRIMTKLRVSSDGRASVGDNASTPLSRHPVDRLRYDDSEGVAGVPFEIDTPEVNWDSVNRQQPAAEGRFKPAIVQAPEVLDDQRAAGEGPINQSGDESSSANVGSTASRCRHPGTVDTHHVDTTVTDDPASPLNADPKQDCDNVRDVLSSILAMTPPPSGVERASMVILAEDTPLADYGLTYRERALKNARLRLRTRMQLT
jgi:hypothetical protein